VLLSLLLERVKESDPTFEDRSRRFFDTYLGQYFEKWPAPGSEDTELGVSMEPEVDHGEAEVHTRVQA
jgi:hypothetical protein